MTEKRFTLTFDDKIVDNLTGIIHEVHSGYDVAMDLSELLNTLNDENEKLKKVAKCELVANHRGEMVSFADSLIRDFCDNKAIEMWEKFKEEKWEEYKYKTGFSQ